MKKIILFSVWSLLSFALIVSCEMTTDIQKKFTDEGERVYLSMTDSLTAYHGVGRVKLEWYISADPKVDTTVIYWNMRKDSVEREFKRTEEGRQKDSLSLELPEGTYIFELFNKNRRGERSLIATAQGVSYGDTYASKLIARPVVDITGTAFDHVTQSNTIRIRWDEAPTGCIAKIKYKKRSTGEEVEVLVDERTSTTTITDVGNRLEHPDDMLYISSVYFPPSSMDYIEAPMTSKEQFVRYQATGTCIENTVYGGVPNTQFTSSYTNQEKTIRLVNTGKGRIFDCNRVADTNPASANTWFRMTINDDQTVNVEGVFSGSNTISDMNPVNSSFQSGTQSLTLRYQVKTAGGTYTVDETLSPKTTPFEKAAVKPFGDKRGIIPGDINSEYDGFPFSCISDGVVTPNNNAWIGDLDASTRSITIDLNETLKLSRMIIWPYETSAAIPSVYNGFRVHKFELWGIAELDESKLQNVAYWADNADPAGTFKQDWEYLGMYEVDRLDLKSVPVAEIFTRICDGQHFCIPASAGPVRYIRFFSRGEIPGNTNWNRFFITELSFFGYAQ